jgi:hypothetical protein
MRGSQSIRINLKFDKLACRASLALEQIVQHLWSCVERVIILS